MLAITLPCLLLNLVKKMSYRIQILSAGFYAFSVWNGGKLLLLYTGNATKIKKKAKELDYDIKFRLSLLNRPDYELDHING